MRLLDLAAHGASIEEVFARSRVERALIIGVESDLLFPVDEQRALSEALSKAGAETTFAPLDCLEGHDSFLIDLERFGREISRFLA